ncbi:tricarboxylic transport [Salmonella enterica subsp. enterica]|uniref:Tricarboxylic transport n=1 Tax=Salmonella enterica I TaxID=59201 RepID=A0A447TX82_SALET|nr:tricarboxylic transport [Salmonella enterica subsp. enterica]
MKKQLLRTLTASILLMSTSVLAQEAPSRTECIAPAKPGGGFDLTCKLIQVSFAGDWRYRETHAGNVYARRRRRCGL